MNADFSHSPYILGQREKESESLTRCVWHGLLKKGKENYTGIGSALLLYAPTYGRSFGRMCKIYTCRIFVFWFETKFSKFRWSVTIIVIIRKRAVYECIATSLLRCGTCPWTVDSSIVRTRGRKLLVEHLQLQVELVISKVEWFIMYSFAVGYSCEIEMRFDTKRVPNWGNWGDRESRTYGEEVCSFRHVS